MDELLNQLLNRLEEVGSNSGEIFDSESRYRMGDAIIDGFVRQTINYTLPEDFGLQTPDANATVRKVLSEYINSAKHLAPTVGVTTFHERLDAFQNGAIKSDGDGVYCDDFFGYSSPEAFDDSGEVISVG